MHGPCRTVSVAIAFLGHGWIAAEPELMTLNELGVPRAHLDAMQALCSPLTQLVKVPVIQQQMGEHVVTNV